METDFDIFKERSFQAHGWKYNYSKVDYKWVDKKVIIICPIHWDFSIRPRAHYADKRWCPSCDNKKSWFSYSSDWAKKEKKLYFIECYNTSEKFVKIGVTAEWNIVKRFQKWQFPYNYNVIWEGSSKDANDLELLIKDTYSYAAYSPTLQFRWHKECFDYSVKFKILHDLRNIS